MIAPPQQVRNRRVRLAVGKDDRPLGFSAVLPISADGIALDGLFVEPDWMRRGVGALLVADLATHARVAGARRVTVIANQRLEVLHAPRIP